MNAPKRLCRKGSREDGVAALELVLVMGVLFAILLFFYPFGSALTAKVRLQRAAAEVARFASSAPNTPEVGSTGRRPTACEVQQDATAAAKRHGLDPSKVTLTLSYQDGYYTTTSTGTVTDCGGAAAYSPTPGQHIQVSMTYGADMGPFAPLYGASGLVPDGVRTITASASAREE